MTFTKARFASFEEYLTAEASDLPEGRCEYWDGELVPVMSESLLNEAIANYLAFVLWQMGIDQMLASPGKISIVVNGRPRTRFPDLTLLHDAHLVLMERSTRVGTTMPPPRLVVEVVSPGDEDSENYTRDYHDKRDQYADRGIPEYWLIDPQRSWVMVGNLVAGRYQFTTFRGSQTLTSGRSETIISQALPTLDLTVTSVLTRGARR
ncbi:MAG: Uma2 family endonuclease [Cyanobacteria bacterium]|jgi:Uma2 family endonuclease|nr:Uma2 family endonuclease [Cyanobacteriota bacterium]